MKWKTLRVVAFDTETTGLSPFDGDRIIEFGAVVLTVGADGKVVDAEAHDWLFNPGIPIPPKVVQLTGISDDDVADAPEFESKAKEIRALLKSGICVAHNYAFDRGMLVAELDRCGLSFPDPFAEIDTLALSQLKFPDARSHKLGDLCRTLDVELRQAHRATDDAEACGRAFIEIARRQDAPEELLGMLDWADALGHPPENPWIGLDAQGRIVFSELRGALDGLRMDEDEVPPAGQPIELHPVFLHWMTMARRRQGERWEWRFAESLRRWVDRYLRVRSSGTHRQNPKSFGPGDWTIDSNALPLP
jgi:DNA polymerase III epsilon subunit family exonuclease